uniref:FBA_2 domain-containing protein n=1 Tax=Caenorhabditis tropicalis TaxID=1561998 RepID=A0A1I7U6C1_9PELO
MSSIWYLKWDDPTKDGVLTLIDWATDLFRTDVWCLFVSKETFHRLKWVKRRQGRIEKLYLSGGEYTEKEIRNMIHSNAENLLFNYITPRFEYPGTLPSRTSFVSGRGFLFTQNHLMTSDFMELSVSYSSLTNSNVNQFLKHWLAGGSPRLKTLSLEIDGVDINEITRGIEGIIPNETLRSEEYWTISGRELTFNDRMYLKRSDGVIATCCIHHPELLFARKMFVLAVWPDAKNNACLIDTFQLL